MPTSQRYNTLRQRIQQLEHLLPIVDPAGNYTNDQIDSVRSYNVLSHAEIEAYIEDIVIDIATTAYNIWFANKTIISPIIFHLAYNYHAKDTPYSMVCKSFINLQKVVKGNNGIKENNIKDMFRFLGFEIDPVLQSTLNNFGKIRGEIVHTSFQTQSALDPVTEKAQVKQILQGLSTFDVEIYSYLNSGNTNRIPLNLKWDKFSFRERIRILFFGR